jgi:hypothetical protein
MQPEGTDDTLKRRPEWVMPEYVPWDTLGPAFFEMWGRPRGKQEQEHLTIYGPSGCGKTYCMTYLLTMRARLRGTHAVVLATKQADATLTDAGWPVIDDWPPDYGQNQVIWWARGGMSDAQQAEQKRRMSYMLATLWQRNANKIIAWDELPYICGDLGQNARVATFYREGRANGIGNVACLQRPSGVTRYVHSENGWTIAFKPKDADDRIRVAEVLGNRAYFQWVLANLNRERYEFVIKHELTGQCYISSLPAVRPTLPTRKEQQAGQTMT